MPEQLTKHPEITLEVLASAGAECAQGAPRKILVNCPAERFCRFPGGEICVYGLPEAASMTQITAADWARLVPPGASAATAPELPYAGDPVLFAGSGLVVGLLLGIVISRFVRARRFP
jgi:hypothetical protein